MLDKLAHMSNGKLTHGFRLKRLFQISEFRLGVVEMQHEKSGANYWHLIREDPNKAFAVQFRTTPKNSTGVSHILEHTALCGSTKYPVRDPFFKMLRRSQATFMNAFTASDWTMYPYSTMNDTDFQNLLSVYTDATFFPKLEKLDFMQEGWRLEPENLKDPESKFLLKGVVYNEMKGVFSNSLNLFGQAVENNLMPITYGNVSGGHPDKIPALTLEDLRKFHKDFYHPSNANFFTYGNVQVEDCLEYLDSECLSRFDNKEPSPNVPTEPRWQEPRTIRLTCQPDPTAADPERCGVVSMSFALNDILEVYENFAMSILCTLLMEGDNAPLYRGLIEKGLGLDWAGPVSGMEKNARTTSFHVGLQGVRLEDLERVPHAIETILSEVVESTTGFPQERVNAVLHQYEIAVRQDSSSFGLNMILGLASIVNHGGDVEACLGIERLVERFKADLAAEPDFLRSLVKNRLLHNPHRLITIMQPDAQWQRVQQQQEDDRLDALTRNLTMEEKKLLTNLANELVVKQKTEEDISCLPCLDLVHINSNCRPEPYTNTLVLDRPLQLNDSPTNGLVYIHALADLSELPEELLVYVPIFTDLFTRLGADGTSYAEMDQLQQLNTGSVCASPHVTMGVAASAAAPAVASVHFSAYSLKNKVANMFDILSRRFRSPDWLDNVRISTLVRMFTAGDWSANAISSEAHRFAMRRAGAHLNSAARMRELWSGLEQATVMRRFAAGLTGDSATATFESLLEKMQMISQHVLRADKLRLSLHGEAENLSTAVKTTKDFLTSLPSADVLAASNISGRRLIGAQWSLPRSTYLALPYSVHYTSLSLPAPLFVDPQFPAEQGGAYGGGSSVSPGQFAFYSYRDPLAQRTLRTYDESIDFAVNTEFSEQDLVEAKLSVFKELDGPVSAGSRGLRAFMTGITDEVQQEHRERLFRVDAIAVKTAADCLKANTASFDASSQVLAGRCVLGPEQSSDWKQPSSDWHSVNLFHQGC